MRTARYRRYLRSSEWKITRGHALSRAENKCEQCGSHGDLEVHHLHYDSLGSEKPSDLKVLCRKCHSKADRHRGSRTAFINGVETYMTKKYGDDWDAFTDWHDAEEEFNEWLETR